MRINNRVQIMREALKAIVPMLSGRKVRVTQQGVSAFVSYDKHGMPERVNIPYIPDEATDELLDATQGFIDHEVAHILFTDSKWLKVASVEKIHTLWNIFEDSFIERKMAKHFTGSGSNLSAMGGFFISEYIEKAIAANPEAVQSILLVPVARAWAGQIHFIEYMKDKWHLVKRLTDKLGPDFPKMVADIASSEDAVKCAREAKKRLSEKDIPPPMPQPKPEKGQKSEPQDGEPGDPGEGEEGEGVPQDGEGDPQDGEEDSKGKKGEKGEKASKPKKQKSKKDKADKAPGEEEGDDEGGAGDLDTDTIDGPTDKPKDESGGKPKDKPKKDGKDKGDKDKGDKDAGDEGDRGDGADPGDEEPGDGSGDADAPDEAGDDDGAGDQSDDSAEPGDKPGAGESTDDAEQSGDSEAGGEKPKSGDKGKPEKGDVNDIGEGKTAATGKGPQQEEEQGMTLYEEIMDSPPGDFDEEVAKALSEKAASEASEADYLVYTKDFDVIDLIDTTDTKPETLARIQDSVDHMVSPLQKDMERAVAARSAAVWTGGFKSGRLHGSALSRLNFGRVDVFRRKQVMDTKDVAVEFLLDASGSMTSGMGRRGTGKSKLEVAAASGYALTSVLDRMGIVSECMTFTTGNLTRDIAVRIQKEQDRMGRGYSRNEPLEMGIIKQFSERMTAEVKRRFAAYVDSTRHAANIDGECVQIAGYRLMQRREKRKILMVASDGMPAGSGDGRSLYAHLKAVVKNLEAHGVEVVGLGIMTDAVKQFYPKSVVIDRVDDLPGEVMRRLKSVLLK